MARTNGKQKIRDFSSNFQGKQWQEYKIQDAIMRRETIKMEKKLRPFLMVYFDFKNYPYVKKDILRLFWMVFIFISGDTAELVCQVANGKEYPINWIKIR